MRKFVLLVMLLAVVGGVGYVGWQGWTRWKQQQGQAQRPRGRQAVPVEVAAPLRTTLLDVGQFSGNLVADSRFVVSARVDGQLKQLRVDMDDRVSSGQVLALLDDEQYVQQVARAQAELAVAEASVLECRSNCELARREFERTEALWKKQIASESDYEQARAQFDVQQARQRLADAQVQQKQAALREAKILLSYTQISASWTGGSPRRVVGERFVNQHDLLKANDRIVSILDIDNLTAVVYAAGSDYAKIKTGQAITLTTRERPGETFAGVVERVSPQLDELSRQAAVKIRVPNADHRLRPGMFVRVELEFARHENVQAAPVTSIVRRGGQRGVFLVDAAAGKARFVACQEGIVSGQLVEVVSPALDGPMVTLGQHLIDDGDAVRIVEPSRPAASQPADLSSAGGPGGGGR